MPFGGFGEPIWHQNWKESRQEPRSNPSEVRSSRDVVTVLAILGGALVAVVLYTGLLAWVLGVRLP